MEAVIEAELIYMCDSVIGARAMLNICFPLKMDGLPGDEALTPLTGLGMPCIGQIQQGNIIPAPRAPDELTDSRICDQRLEALPLLQTICTDEVKTHLAWHFQIPMDQTPTNHETRLFRASSIEYCTLATPSTSSPQRELAFSTVCSLMIM